jgi:hypothetical protein
MNKECKLESSGNNETKTVEGAHELIIDIMKTIMDIDYFGGIITSYNLTINYIDDSHETKTTVVV